jgi:hypothetical protein
MSSFKLHKLSHGWFTNDHAFIFSILAQFICVASMALNLVMKEWAKLHFNFYTNFMKVNIYMISYIDLYLIFSLTY